MKRMVAPAFRIRVKMMILKQGGVGSARLRRWSNQSSTMKMFFNFTAQVSLFVGTSEIISTKPCYRINARNHIVL